MISLNDKATENSKTFEAYETNSKKYEILMKKIIEQNKLIFQMAIIEESNKKIFCSLYEINSLKNIEVLSLYKSWDEVFDQICDYINNNEQLKIKSIISIQSSKAILTIPINSRKYKQISFELKYENSELVELLDTVDKLIKKYRIWKKNKSFRRKSIW